MTTAATTRTSVAQRLFFVSAAASVAAVGILISAAPVQAPTPARKYGSASTTALRAMA